MGDAVMRSSLSAIFSSPSGGGSAAPAADGAVQQQEGARRLLAEAASAGDVAAASAWVQFGTKNVFRLSFDALTAELIVLGNAATRVEAKRTERNGER